MQLLFEQSEEGEGVEGLAVLRGRVRRLRSGDRPLPHLGWCPVGDRDEAYYFAHSFCAQPADASIVRASAVWGETFPAVVQQDRIVGFQFHPERSGPAGLDLLGRTLRGEEPRP
jgi:glutamine amidotransferase